MIGRKKETDELNRLYHSDKAQLVAVYGRRRVGKTYLIDEVFKNRITFRHAGLSPADVNGKNMMKNQLKHFYYSLQLQGMEKSKQPTCWLEAFFLLEQFLEKKDDGQKQVVFLDELPWLDTPRSGFLIAFEGFWNNWGCHRPNLMVIVCGSATSWVMDKLINNHGGLYNRVTYEIRLAPFSLLECEKFFSSIDVKLSRYDVTRSYMILGGIPYYLRYFEKGSSLSQNIDRLFFFRDAKLYNEFDRLFDSAFSNPELMKKIIRILSTRGSGYTRKELVQEKELTKSGGTLTEALNALIVSDFIEKYVPFGKGKREERYRLTDPFCIFYLRFVEGNDFMNPHFWQEEQDSPAVISWCGFAFENVCFRHIDQIKAALGISGISTKQSAFVKRDEAGGVGTQVDLIIDRKDNVVNLCEIKFLGRNFTVTKDYYRTLLGRKEILSAEIPKKKVIHNTLITTYGLEYNEYSGIFDSTILLDDLYKW